MEIIVNSVDYKGSFVDGPGIRSLLFLQGCNVRCNGCHNTVTWDISKGTPHDITDLAEDIRSKCRNKKLTITGGEPLLQKEALTELLKQLEDFDLCLYTSYELEDVPDDIIKYLTYIKTGKYEIEKRCSTIPYCGSTNQKFINLRDK